MRVFLTSPWIPAEWIRAHGHEPRGIWFAENFRSDGTPLSAGICAFAERAVRFTATQPDSAVIFTTACDQLRRAFDAVTFHGKARSFLFNLPATQTPAAKEIYRAELERLGKFLLALGGSAPTPEILRAEMLRADESRRCLRETAPAAAARSFAEAVVKFHDEGIVSTPSAARPGNQVPLALVGGPLGGADWNLFDAIETAGGRIVLNATKTGERSLCPTIENQRFGDEDVAATDALVTGYFENIVDAFQRPNTRLYSWLKSRLASRQVRGIVLWHFTGCDLWRAEAQTLREVFGLPVLLLEADEADEADGPSPREVTRIEAFVETLK
jgi:benzoyl-CoA reductase/2-hydroxyglutaryl-CoA dehydratase subunit BcrC/BadD/HgdB